jgi:hypothetical protein
MQASRVNYSNDRSTWVTKGKNFLVSFGLAQRPRPQQPAGMQLPHQDVSYNQPLNNQNQMMYNPNQPSPYQQGYNYPQQAYNPGYGGGAQPMYNPQMPPANNYPMGGNTQPMGIYNPPAQSYNQPQPQQAQQNTVKKNFFY